AAVIAFRARRPARLRAIGNRRERIAGIVAAGTDDDAAGEQPDRGPGLGAFAEKGRIDAERTGHPVRLVRAQRVSHALVPIFDAPKDRFGGWVRGIADQIALAGGVADVAVRVRHADIE